MSVDVEELRAKIKELRMEILETDASLNQLFIAGNRTASIIRRLCGSEEFAQAVAAIQRMIILARQLEIALNRLEIASGPLGWLMAGISFISLGLNMYDSMRGL